MTDTTSSPSSMSLTDRWLEAGRRFAALLAEAARVVRDYRALRARVADLTGGRAAAAPGEVAALGARLLASPFRQAWHGLRVQAAFRELSEAHAAATAAWEAGDEQPPGPVHGLRALAQLDQIAAAVLGDDAPPEEP
jgi:hypothetical protein